MCLSNRAGLHLLSRLVCCQLRDAHCVPSTPMHGLAQQGPHVPVRNERAPRVAPRHLHSCRRWPQDLCMHVTCLSPLDDRSAVYANVHRHRNQG
eukprot:785519-Alexandrium_andersonii.AAC.1